ncbi:hypothetical protein O3P69_020675 [Scylla paramamosain]|uniref:Uncharacterized protein n=1 Tax=Scylla paramamosain TaxID=85552 RepID=A0AAW0TNF6_SCYPA
MCQSLPGHTHSGVQTVIQSSHPRSKTMELNNDRNATCPPRAPNISPIKTLSIKSPLTSREMYRQRGPSPSGRGSLSEPWRARAGLES